MNSIFLYVDQVLRNGLLSSFFLKRGCDVGNSEQVYIKPQRHLDSQAVGFPATRTGAEIKILKHIFTPEEAEIATCLTYKVEPLLK